MLCLLSVLLLLGVAVPQERVLGEENFAALVSASDTWARFFLVDLGLGRMPTSPVFLAVLGLFFLQLASVLIARIGPTWRRAALRQRREEALVSWANQEESLSVPLPAEWNVPHVMRTLRGFGYQTRRSGVRTIWGIKNRTAPLGFLLFHISFFLLCAGGMMIYYTRFVGTATLSEGQRFSGGYNRIERQPPLGGPPSLNFSVAEVDPGFDDGHPVHLNTVLRFRQAGSEIRRTARINHPARWGNTSILVSRAGLAPVLWLQDGRGFTLDRVAVPISTSGGSPTVVDLGAGRLTAHIHPLAAETPFPERDALQETPLTYQLVRDGAVVFDGVLRQGEAVTMENARVVVEDMRFWVGVVIISERGGGFLILGFLLGIVGLVWRLLWYRREVALTWADGDIRLVGRSEYFSARFREELDSILSTLVTTTGSDRPDRVSS